MLQPTQNPEQSHRTIRIISVVAATCIALSSGTNYAYSAWAPQFAERLQLSATQQNLIGNFGNIGMYAMGIPGGMLIDKRGPRYGVFLGVICLACGYYPLRSAYLQGPGSMTVGALCFFGMLTGLGGGTAFGAALKVAATNWPKHRGTATAFPLSAFGLSALFYTTAASVIYPNDTAGYLLLLSVGTTSMVLLGGIFLQIVKPATGYQAVPTDDRPGLVRRDSNRMRRSSSHSRNTSKASLEETGTADETSSLVSSSPGDVDESKPHTDGPHKPDITGFRALRTLKFWQLFILLSLLCGVGLMTINNIGNDARALWSHYDDSASHDFIQKRQLMHVSILSFGSFVGRLVSGIGSDWLIHHHASRIWNVVVAACVFSIAQMIALLLENPNQLFWLSGLTGVAYGILFGVYPSLVADAFGPSGMGINWGAMTVSPVFSGNLFNLAYGSILDKHSHFIGDGNGGGETKCTEGKACYSGAYWLTLMSAMTAICWSLWCIRHDKVQRIREARQVETREHDG